MVAVVRFALAPAGKGLAMQLARLLFFFFGEAGRREGGGGGREGGGGTKFSAGSFRVSFGISQGVLTTSIL